MSTASNSLREIRPPLETFKGEMPPHPAWFEKALAMPTEAGRVGVEGADIVWKAWGGRGQEGVILVHGGVAHKQWWDAIAPFLAESRRVVAIDMSGMGDSGHRDVYRMPLYAEEVKAVARDAGLFDAGKPFVVGHSFGGFVTMVSSMEFGDELAGAIILDSPVRPPEEQRSSSPPQRGGKTYEQLETAIARFRLLPPQPCEAVYVVDHIARNSLKPVEGGWSWKFDPNLWAKLEYQRRDPEVLRDSAKCPLAFFRGADTSLVTDEIWAFMQETFGAGTPMISIPDAHHHLILDQPLAVAAALETLMQSGWGQR
ncbi:alpha/beta hydrolase [Hyphobacterium sp. CCMP332]|uniref:alpha/beta fold hydrolase n=1 Tax=Hyphobacterium sp. CCMP332 TaxID=2749086 RepID=UPI001650040E|nr:alpha/beta hydrolase [Hyphobacterium sp. CCMP332]QNL20208.1 alpha/beta hydrolase [Hyphobacterium sp. CCMP332]